MKIRTGIFTILLFASITSFSQQKDTLVKKLDSLSKKSNQPGADKINTNPAAYNSNTKFTPRTYFILLGSDLKQAFTKPFHMKKRDWGYTAIFLGAGGALYLADEPIQRTALKLRNNSAAVRNTSVYVSNFGGLYETYTLAAFAAYGYIFKVDKMQTTTLLATQAYLTGGAVESVLKFLTGETRPQSYADGIEAEPRFKGPFGKTTLLPGKGNVNSAFPSGHTTVAFAAATVFAMEYRNHPYIPVIAYSAATLIGLSRITNNAHWATDVFAGAALGYLVGRQVVNNYHRYMEIKQGKTKKTTMRFNLNYQFGHLMPGLVYSF